MKRSTINTLIQEADAFLRGFGVVLPPFAYLSPDEMVADAARMQGVIGARLGWDITDYGEGRFNEMGLFLFTLRNGTLREAKAGGGMCY
ncbi:MAG: D-lyxose/D-mannose family sugar isomerase, partial [Pseudomonadota bacterium]